MTINKRLRALERLIGGGPDPIREREIEEIGRRLIDVVNNIGIDGSLGDIEAMLEALREARRRHQQR
jgi:hypothetical protein